MKENKINSHLIQSTRLLEEKERERETRKNEKEEGFPPLVGVSHKKHKSRHKFLKFPFRLLKAFYIPFPILGPP